MTTNGPDRRRALVVGMGIGGIATAARLHRAGWTPVVVERAASRRSGGYMVAVFGAGHAAATRLGINEHLHDRTSTVPSLEVDRAGRRAPGMSYSNLPSRPWTVLRGDVEKAAYATLPSDVKVRYSTTPVALAQDDNGVDVTLRNTATDTETTERFELVIGADGLRSTVRRLVFGPHEEYLKRLNYMIAAFELPRTPTGLKDGQSAMLLEPGRGLSIFGFADHNPTALLSYKTHDVDAEFTEPPGQRLRKAFGPEPLGKLLTETIEAFEAAPEKLFDSAEQVIMDSWHKGRVVLLGDSAWCVTLYAGMGVSSGLSGAEVLGTALERHPDDISAALAVWEQTMRPYIADYQKSAFTQRAIFVPDSFQQIVLRRAISLVTQLPFAGRLMSRFMPASGTKDADIAASMGASPVAVPTAADPAAGDHKVIKSTDVVPA